MKRSTQLELVGTASDLLHEALVKAQTARILVECCGFKNQAKAIKKSLATLESQQAGLQQFYRLEFSKEMKRENKKAK